MYYVEIKSFVEDVSPALLATIEQEFEKVSKMDPPQPSKAPVGSVSFNLLC
jgi:cytoskeleton-associated protein 5